MSINLESNPRGIPKAPFVVSSYIYSLNNNFNV